MHIRWLVLICVAAAACGGDTVTGNNSNNTPTTTTSVTMSSKLFQPAAILVSKGATVTWTNQDNFPHNVTFSNASIVSIANFSTGSKTAVMPTIAGTYSYQCTIHPGMNGTVTVQ